MTAKPVARIAVSDEIELIQLAPLTDGQLLYAAPDGDDHSIVQPTSAPIYVASRASLPARPAMWKRLRDEHGWNITSTWIDEAGECETDDFGDLWLRIEREISKSKGLILYAEREDFPLKGALVEVGIAIGMRKPVAVCLDGKPFLEGRSLRPVGSWLHHPLVRLFHTDQTLRAAHDWIASGAA